MTLHNSIIYRLGWFYGIWVTLIACKHTHSTESQKKRYPNTVRKIVCSYGPITPFHVSLSYGGALKCAGTAFDDKPSREGKFNTYYTGKLSDSLFTVFEKLVLDYKTSHYQKRQEVIIGASWYCLRIYYQNGQSDFFEGIYNNSEQKILRKLMNSYKSIMLNKKSGGCYFETLNCTYPLLPKRPILPIDSTSFE